MHPELNFRGIRLFGQFRWMNFLTVFASPKMDIDKFGCGYSKSTFLTNLVSPDIDSTTG